MNVLKSIFYSSFFLVFVYCSSPKLDVKSNGYDKLPPNFQSLLQAHGGLDTWQSFGGLEYDLINPKDSSREHHVIDLLSRKDLVEADSFKIGFDGKEVWVSPNKKALGDNSARFYHNLFFYFFSMPYVLADSGINYQPDTVKINGETYESIKTTFNSGVGDADKDIYKMIIDPKTKRLFGLLYTVTYFTNVSHEKYNFLKYEDWQEISGLQFAGKLVSYKYANDSIKEKRGEYSFSNVRLKKEAPSKSLFERPSLSEIDSMIKR
jgi:hypothetical protein